MAKTKLPIRWKVGEAPTGMYRSFHGRAWPMAHWKNERQVVCASIECESNYSAAAVREGTHAELAVRIADHGAKPVWEWKRLKARFKTLDEAKAGLEEFLLKNPSFWPEDLKPAPKVQTPSSES